MSSLSPCSGSSEASVQRSVVSQPTVQSAKVFSVPGVGLACESVAGAGGRGVAGVARGAGPDSGPDFCADWGVGWLGEQAIRGSTRAAASAEKIGLHDMATA
jgi:hypothetical protein